MQESGLKANAGSVQSIRRLPSTLKFSFGESTALMRRIFRPASTGIGRVKDLLTLRLRLPGQDIRRVHPDQHAVVAFRHGAIGKRRGPQLERIVHGALGEGVLKGCVGR